MIARDNTSQEGTMLEGFVLDRMKLRTGEADEAILQDCIESAKAAIMTRRFPCQEWPDSIEPRYLDLLFRCAMDLYNKEGSEGELSHSENGVSRSYESSWISQQLLNEVVPYVSAIG